MRQHFTQSGCSVAAVRQESGGINAQGYQVLESRGKRNDKRSQGQICVRGWLETIKAAETYGRCDLAAVSISPVSSGRCMIAICGICRSIASSRMRVLQTVGTKVLNTLRCVSIYGKAISAGRCEYRRHSYIYKVGERSKYDR